MVRSKRPFRRRPQDDGPVDPADVSLFRDAMRQLDVVPEADQAPLDPPPAEDSLVPPTRTRTVRPRDDEEPPIDPVEASLFHDAMQELDVVPASGRVATAPPTPAIASEEPSPREPPKAPPERHRQAAKRRSAQPPVDPADVSLFMRAMQRLDVVPDKESASPRRTRSGIRRKRPPKPGAQKIDDRLDLHRSRVEEGLVRLEHFVQRASRRGHRCVIVITGKGHHSPGGIAVLRRAVEDWIRRDARRYIEVYSDAPRDEGGRGAFLLYLRQGG